MKIDKHYEISVHHVTPSGKCLTGNSFIIQSDNDPKLNATAVKQYGIIMTENMLCFHSCLHVLINYWTHFAKYKEMRVPQDFCIVLYIIEL